MRHPRLDPNWCRQLRAASAVGPIYPLVQPRPGLARCGAAAAVNTSPGYRGPVLRDAVSADMDSSRRVRAGDARCPPVELCHHDTAQHLHDVDRFRRRNCRPYPHGGTRFLRLAGSAALLSRMDAAASGGPAVPWPRRHPLPPLPRPYSGWRGASPLGTPGGVDRGVGRIRSMGPFSRSPPPCGSGWLTCETRYSCTPGTSAYRFGARCSTAPLS